MRNRNRTGPLRAAAASAVILLAPIGVHGAQVDPQDFTQLEKGRYLALVGDCASCHTLPGGGRPYAGGRSIETPFGDVLASNITPDRETGIGAWSDDEFDAALRRGRRPDGSRLYPAMPYNAYTRMSRAEVLALRAYLNTVTAVSNRVDTNWAVMRRATLSRARRCRAGTRRTSPATRTSASAAGPVRKSSATSRAATTASPQPPGPWPRSWSSPRRR